jgi:hypothetical protein
MLEPIQTNKRRPMSWRGQNQPYVLFKKAVEKGTILSFNHGAEAIGDYLASKSDDGKAPRLNTSRFKKNIETYCKRENHPGIDIITNKDTGEEFVMRRDERGLTCGGRILVWPQPVYGTDKPEMNNIVAAS